MYFGVVFFNNAYTTGTDTAHHHCRNHHIHQQLTFTIFVTSHHHYELGMKAFSSQSTNASTFGNAISLKRVQKF